MNILKLDYTKMTTVEVARGLLGHYLCHETGSGILKGKIVETEAYLSIDDPACHAAKGKTRRNASMFGPAGKAYIYLIYGCHYCFNVVTNDEGCGEAVLIRALEPVMGLAVMKANRGFPRSQKNLANGPGKLCQALGINRILDGHDLQEKPLYLAKNCDLNFFEIEAVTRIGISKGRDKLLRFYIKGSKYLSRS